MEWQASNRRATLTVIRHLVEVTRCYGFAFNFAGRPVHHRIDTFDTLEWALRWADPWQERIWEEASDADESSILVSRPKRPGAL
jgi:hypothetical protein